VVVSTAELIASDSPTAKAPSRFSSRRLTD